MPVAYTREFLVEAYASRFRDNMTKTEYNSFKQRIGFASYDAWVAELGLTAGKKKFREQASLDADAIRKYKNENN